MLNNRFTEYGLTGTFFIVMQLVLFYNLEGSTLYGEIINYVLGFQERVSFLSDKDTSTLLGVLAFAIVFVIGLSLDLVGSILRTTEMQCLALEVKKNIEWLEKFTQMNPHYISADYKQILSAFEKKPLYKTLFNFKEIKESFLMRKEADRMRSFFVSHILINEGTDKSQLLIEQIHLWRIGRVISLILWLFAFEVLFFVYLKGSSFSISALLIFAVAMFSTLLATSSYQRMLTTLFSLLYVVMKKKH